MHAVLGIFMLSMQTGMGVLVQERSHDDWRPSDVKSTCPGFDVPHPVKRVEMGA
jgi:hypothetical protein